MLYPAVKIIWSILSVSIIFLVLLHSPKGDGVAGIGGQAQMFSSTRSAEASLNRLTWGLITFFLALSIILSAGWISPPVTSKALPLSIPPANQSTNQVKDLTKQVPANLPGDPETAPVPSNTQPQDNLLTSPPSNSPSNSQ